MSKRPRSDPKVDSLRQEGALNPRPEDVTDPLFAGDEFFDPRDLVQVKYEMLRGVRVEGKRVTDCARTFGFSRPSFYQAQAAFAREGLPGLVPRKRGPRGPHKLTEEVMAFVEEICSREGSLSPAVLAERIEDRFDIAIHPRSVERALRRREKKRQ